MNHNAEFFTRDQVIKAIDLARDNALELNGDECFQWSDAEIIDKIKEQ
jgi:hypothetical protein